MIFAKERKKSKVKTEITGKRRRPSLARAGLKQGGREREAMRPSRKAALLRAQQTTAARKTAVGRGDWQSDEASSLESAYGFQGQARKKKG